MLPNKTTYYIVFFLLILLVVIRFIEKEVFDDGLIEFFHYNYLTEKLPEIPFMQIIIVDSLRFWTNSLISMAILYILFPQKDLLKFLLGLYGFVYVIALLLLIYQLYHYQAGNYIKLFYIRRVLIQPLLLFILIPGLLYQKQKSH